MTLPRLYTMAEVIDSLGLCRNTVRTLIDSGELPAIKIGAQWRFRADAVDAYVTSQQTQARALRSVG